MGCPERLVKAFLLYPQCHLLIPERNASMMTVIQVSLALLPFRLNTIRDKSIKDDHFLTFCIKHQNF